MTSSGPLGKLRSMPYVPQPCLRTSDINLYVVYKQLLLFSSHVKGIHLNMFVTPPPYGPFSLLSAYLFPSWSLGDEQHKVLPLKKLFGKLLWESGYLHVHGKRSQHVFTDDNGLLYMCVSPTRLEFIDSRTDAPNRIVFSDFGRPCAKN
jgi:hypothetical protein